MIEILGIPNHWKFGMIKPGKWVVERVGNDQPLDLSQAPDRLALANALVSDGVFVADPAGLMNEINDMLFVNTGWDVDKDKVLASLKQIRAALGIDSTP